MVMRWFQTSRLLWRDAGVDERGCFENSCTYKGTVGSNPTPAVTKKARGESCTLRIFYKF